MKDHQSNANSTNQRFQDLCDQLIRLSTSFKTLWIVVDLIAREQTASNSNIDTMPGSVASSTIQLALKMQKWFVQMKQSLDCCFKIRYICSSAPEGFNAMVHTLLQVVETTANTHSKDLAMVRYSKAKESEHRVMEAL